MIRAHDHPFDRSSSRATACGSSRSSCATSTSSPRPRPTARCGSSGSRGAGARARRRRTSRPRSTRQREGRMLPWAVRNLATGAIVGSTRYHDIVAEIDRVEIGYTWYAKSWQRSHVNTSCKLLLLTHAFEDARLQGRGLAHRQVQLRLAARDRGARREEGRRDPPLLDAPRRLGARHRDVQHHRERVAGGEAAPDAAAGAPRQARPSGERDDETTRALIVARRLRWLCGAGDAAAQPPDVVLLNGKIVTVDAAVVGARGARDPRRQDRRARHARPRSASSRARATRVDRPAAGARSSPASSIRTCTRSAPRCRFSTEVNWIGARSLEEALGAHPRRRAARCRRALADRRRRLERAAVRGEPPADAGGARGGRAEQSGLRAARLRLGRDDRRRLRRRSASRSEADLPAGGTLERDGERLDRRGHRRRRPRSSRCSTGCRSRPSREQVEGTKAFFRELNRLGHDRRRRSRRQQPDPRDYQALFKVWRRGELTVRVAYTLERPDAGGGVRRDQEPRRRCCRWASATTCCASTASASASRSR